MPPTKKPANKKPTTKQSTALDLPMRLFKTPAAWEKWLKSHHTKSAGIWMQIAKKDSGIASVNYQQALDVALCYGWIDGQRRSYDERSFVQRFTPRGPSSIWSKINTGKAEALIKAGRMQPAGLAAIDAAKASGRWESAYQSWSNRDVPLDLQAALDAKPNAKTFFETLRGQNRYAIIFRVTTAKKPETRARRIAQYVEMLDRNETIYEQQKSSVTKRR